MCHFTSEIGGKHAPLQFNTFFIGFTVKCVTIKLNIFGSHSDHYAFVTFYNMEDAFAAIDNGGKLRQPDELPFDICFGGRRQFCNTNYTDLGRSNTNSQDKHYTIVKGESYRTNR